LHIHKKLLIFPRHSIPIDNIKNIKEQCSKKQDKEKKDKVNKIFFIKNIKFKKNLIIK